MAPIIRESPPSAAFPSSSEEDTSSDQEMEQQPAKNPAPARQQSDGSEKEEEEGEESDEVGLPGQLGGNGVLTKRPLQPPPPSGRESSDDEEEESESDESLSEPVSQAEANVPSRKLADTVESSDEIGENGVVIRRLPRPPPQRKDGSADDYEEEESESESESGEASSVAPAPLPKGNVPLPNLVRMSQLKRKGAETKLVKSPPPEEKARPAELAKSPPAKTKDAATDLPKSPPPEKAPPVELATLPPAKRKALTAKLPMSPSRKKAVAAATTEVAKSSPPKKPGAAAAAIQVSKSPVAKKEIAKSPDVIAPAGAEEDHGEKLKYNAEKHLEEKSESYWYLWQQVLALDAEHPGMSLKEVFLKIPDKKARALDTKVKKQMLAEINQDLRRQGIEKEVIRKLGSLIQ